MKTLLLAFILFPMIATSQSFQSYLNEIEFNPKRLNQSNLQINDSTISDNFKEYRSVTDWGTEVLVQAKLFSRSKGSKLLGIKSYEADMQCSFHKHKLFTIDANHKIKSTTIEEQFDYLITDYYDTTIVHPILRKRLQQIQSDYLDKTATFMQVAQEIYSPYLLFSKKEKTVQLTLSSCDFIIVNYGIFTEAEWEIIAKSVKSKKFKVK